jgi:allophanate hydrolase subunit 1
MTEANKAYTELMTKFGNLEEKNANLRSELIRITKERNAAESIAHKKKLKSKILQERVKTLEASLQDKIKECSTRSKVNTQYKKMNEDLQDNLSKVLCGCNF